MAPDAGGPNQFKSYPQHFFKPWKCSCGLSLPIGMFLGAPVHWSDCSDSWLRKMWHCQMRYRLLPGNSPTLEKNFFLAVLAQVQTHLFSDLAVGLAQPKLIYFQPCPKLAQSLQSAPCWWLCPSTHVMGSSQFIFQPCPILAQSLLSTPYWWLCPSKLRMGLSRFIEGLAHDLAQSLQSAPCWWLCPSKLVMGSSQFIKGLAHDLAQASAVFYF